MSTPSVLSDSQKKQLSSMVDQMVDKGYPDEDIKAASQMFVDKFGQKQPASDKGKLFMSAIQPTALRNVPKPVTVPQVTPKSVVVKLSQQADQKEQLRQSQIQDLTNQIETHAGTPYEELFTAIRGTPAAKVAEDILKVKPDISQSDLAAYVKGQGKSTKTFAGAEKIPSSVTYGKNPGAATDVGLATIPGALVGGLEDAVNIHPSLPVIGDPVRGPVDFLMRRAMLAEGLAGNNLGEAATGATMIGLEGIFRGLSPIAKSEIARLSKEKQTMAAVKAALDNVYNKNEYLNAAQRAFDKGGIKGLKDFADKTNADVILRNREGQTARLQTLKSEPAPVTAPASPVETPAPPVAGPTSGPPLIPQEPGNPLPPTVRPLGEPPSTIEQPVTQPQVTEPPVTESSPQPTQSAQQMPSTSGGTALANSVSSAIRSAVKLGGFAGVPRKSIEDFAKGAVEKGYTDPANALGIADDIVNAGKGSLDHEQSVGLASVLDGLVAKHDELSLQLENTLPFGGDPNIARQLSILREQIGKITNAANIAGTEWGRSGVARQILAKADTSVSGIIARRQKIVGNRRLTNQELFDATQEAKALKEAGAAKDARITELEGKLNQQQADTYFADARKTFKPPAQERIKVLDTKITDAGARLAQKWKDYKPTLGARSELFPGTGLLAEQATRLAIVVPEVLELSRYHFEKGAITLGENAKNVVATLKGYGVDDISEQDVAAVLSGQVTGSRTHPVTAWEDFKAEARGQFQDARADHQKRANFIEQQAREIRDNYVGAERSKAEQTLKAERDQLAREQKASRDAENAFWKDVKAREREHQQGIKDTTRKDRQDYIAFWKREISHADNMQRVSDRVDKRAADATQAIEDKKLTDAQKAYDKALKDKDANARKEYIDFWRGSTAGQRAAAMNRIDKLQEKLDVFDKEGVIVGAKSKIKQAEDPVLRGLTIKEASLKNRMYENERKMKLQTEFDNLGPVSQSLRRYNPWTFARTVVASFDDSFPLNQGGLALFSDPLSWGRGLKASLRSIGQAGFDTIKAEIRAHPGFERAEAAGLFEGGANLADIFGAEQLSKVPGLGHSERMYEGAADAMRFDMFNAWVNLSEVGGKPLNLQELKGLAKEVKTWTGQGAWGQGLQGLSKPFFALRYRLSQAEVLFHVPLIRTWKLATETGNYAPFKVILKKYAQAYATMTTTAVTAKTALHYWGPKDKDGQRTLDLDLNPTSTNFGRLVGKVNDTTVSVDIMPPALRLAKVMSMIAFGQKTTATGKEQKATDFKNKDLQEEVLSNYITSGLHPVPAMAWAVMKGRTNKNMMYFGRSVDFSKAQAYKDAALQFLPISIQNAKQIWDDPNLSTWEKIAASSIMPWAQVNAYQPFKKPEKEKPNLGKEIAPGVFVSAKAS